MLVLTRKPGERIVIETENGERIVVALCQLRVGQVRIGIEAPRNFRIMREELIENKENDSK